jgi:hypothetical protein
MAINSQYYGSLQEAGEYFETRLHERAWSSSLPLDRSKALLAATRILNALNYKGDKAAVYAAKAVNAQITDEQIRAAEVSQPLEFPRGADTEVPEDIRIACYEIAYSLLDGKDPEAELVNLGISSQGYSSIRTSYSRDQVPIEHIVNGVPNSQAWRLIRPFLRDDDAVRLSRVS